MKGVAPHVGFYALLATHRPAVICDVGSLDGQQALRFKRICPKADVIAFEANPSSCEHIRQNVQGSGVVVEHLAASNKQGRVDFHAVQERPEGVVPARPYRRSRHHYSARGRRAARPIPRDKGRSGGVMD